MALQLQLHRVALLVLVARAAVHLQGFPVVHQNTLKAAGALGELCKQGLVDVNDLVWRFTAGKSV